MDLRRVAPVAGAVACLSTALVLVAPFLLIEGQGDLLGDYYGSGPVGAGAVGFLAVIGAVVFLAGERGNADPETIGGVTVVLGTALLGLAGLWYAGIDENVLFSFPAPYGWLENHAPAVLACTVGVLGSGVAYAYAVLTP